MNANIKRELIKNTIDEILCNDNFQSMVIETINTTNHIEKIKNADGEFIYFWVIKSIGNHIINERDSLPRTFLLAGSITNELCAWLEKKREIIKKISVIQVINNFDLQLC